MSDSAPPPIRPLPETVVNRIAAGEVLARPSNAVKELLENSLDARSTTVSVACAQGGLKMMQITDNGCGIAPEDFRFLCRRFATSKLKTYDQLQGGEVDTFGFRGEALASVSHVAHVSVTSRTAAGACAFRGTFRDGALLPIDAGIAPDLGGPEDPAPGEDVLQAYLTPTSGTQGTAITVEDLFYNVPARRQAFTNPRAEYVRILDIVSRYAVHYPGVAITCRQHGASRADLSTPGRLASPRQAIQAIYGAEVARNLHDIDIPRDTTGDLKVAVRGLFSAAESRFRNPVFFLFINNRAVSSPSLKRAVDTLYANLMLTAGGKSSFVYLSLTLPGAHVDVNVHPTKRFVNFLEEDRIVELIVSTMADRLQTENTARRFEVTPLGSPALDMAPSTPRASASGPRAPDTPSTPRTRPSSSISSQTSSPQFMVRNSSASQTLDSFLLRRGDLRAAAEPGTGAMVLDAPDTPSGQATGTPSTLLDTPTRGAPILLRSVRLLRQQCVAASHSDLLALVRESIFVGIIDGRRSLLQHGTRLMTFDHVRLAYELFYQQVLVQFSQLNTFEFDQPPSVRDLMLLVTSHGPLLESDVAASLADSLTAGHTSAEDLATKLAEVLLARASMLQAYFGIGIDEQARLTHLPVILPGHLPVLARLPIFLCRLAHHVPWAEESPCLEGLARELARFYAPDPRDITDAGGDAFARPLEQVVFPYIKSYLLPPEHLATDGSILQVASLPDLYRVFERC
ncbi:hypothetical protein H696_00823 [Fonticula alba]|uniref:DNA mismatch repair protein S5 domain-containing protein n=1 Tax=Fonticula alba TaxID=691883 RepID=A0A058ZH39_FONAL|nr:hypothetical protein H696_00823 [Fonticula alba]KCV73281.1 hypothetical protein H696_00823 [Fonticula alba]|eukprot:XP_009492982.1 hypothetical protein H696_00823 [Fonticula alba]